MKTLLILRHAKSSWKHDNLTDHDRPLKKRGEQAAVLIGELLRKHDLTPQRIISSTAQRALNTAKLVAEACHYEERIVTTRIFYGAGVDDFVAVLRTLDDADARVMVVGHNPDLEMLLESLTGAMESLPTAALAQVALPIDAWEELEEDTSGELLHVWTPNS